MDAFVTCFGTIVVLAIIFGFIAFLRYMNYKETLALAEKGLTRPDAKNSKGLLRWGVVVTALGAALTLGLYPIGFLAGGSSISPVPALIDVAVTVPPLEDTETSPVMLSTLTSPKSF